MKVNISKLTEEQKDAIEKLATYRFNHRITTRNIYDWLQNFDETELDMALLFCRMLTIILRMTS